MMCLKQPLGGALNMPEPCRAEIRVRKIQLGGSEAQVGILASLFGSGKMTSPLCASVSLCLQNKSQRLLSTYCMPSALLVAFPSANLEKAGGGVVIPILQTNN